MLLVTELTGGLQIQNSKFIEVHIFTFQKNLKKFTDIHEGITHMCVNFQGKIHSNEGCAKKTNLGQFNT
jgi:hypothetical protein